MAQYNYFNKETGVFIGAQTRRNQRLKWVYNQLSPMFFCHYNEHQYRIIRTDSDWKVYLWHRDIYGDAIWRRLAFLGCSRFKFSPQGNVFCTASPKYLRGQKIAERHLNKFLRRVNKK